MIKDTLTYDIVGSFLRPAEIKKHVKLIKTVRLQKKN